MRLGMFMMPVHPPTRSFTETMEEDAAKSIYADELGFDELWLGEHFSASSEPIPSAMMFMASLLPRTKDIKFGTAVVNLPNHDPVIVAAEVAQFDHMSRGRFLFGIGPGGLLSDFELFGNNDPGVRTRKTIEGVDLIKKIWAQDPPYEFDGEFRQVRITKAIMPDYGMGYMPKPYQKPHPPISISLASPFSSTAKTAAQQGWSIISANIIPPYSVASHWDIYSKACIEAGREPRGEDWRVSRNIMVAQSDSEAYDRVFGDDGANNYFFTYMYNVLGRVGMMILLKPRHDMPDEEVTPQAITETCVLHGSPRTVLDKLVAFRDQVGPFGTLLMTGLDWSGPNEAWEREAMRLLATEVMPKFRQHCTAMAAE